jgi:hypothetical protein
MLGVPAAVLADELTGYLMQEIMVRGVRGGLLAPLAAQLDHDMTHLQGQRIEDIFDPLDNGGPQARWPCWTWGRRRP